MEGITLPSDADNYTAQVIEYRNNYGTLSRMILAQRYTSDADKKNDSMTITVITHATQVVHLSHEAMNNLCMLWGYDRNLDAAYGDKCAELEDTRSEIAALEQVIATMKQQESFRMALLESVASAAKNFIRSGRNIQQVQDALDALDAWQPDDASTDVSAPDAPKICPECGDVDGAHDDWCPHADGDAEWRDDVNTTSVQG